MAVMSVIKKDIADIVKSPLPWKELYGKTVLITGAAGALPSYMVLTLLALNDSLTDADKCHVIALARNSETARALFRDKLDRSDLTLLVQDVCDPIALDHDVHVIIHAASPASPKYYGVDPVGTINPNVLGTHQLLSFAAKHKTETFLFFSTSEVYGSVAGDGSAGVKETDYGYIDPTQVRACYAESKRLGETLCVAWGHQHKIDVKIVRPYHTYGPGFKLDDGRVFADFVANVLRGENIVMNSDGSAIRSFCYITDAVKAFFLVLLKGENGQAYNVGNPNAAISMLELAQLLVRLFPDKKLKIHYKEPEPNAYIKSTVSRVVPNVDKIGKLGWRPEIQLDEGFMRMVQSYQEKKE